MEITDKELELEYSMEYKELCSYLILKYGPINEPYFVNEKCKSVNQKIKRTNEGLFIHHIKENSFIMLANTQWALKAPFEYQQGCNLLYCNYFEHMFLHIAIVKEFLKPKSFEKNKMAVGIGGLVNYIFPEIIDYLNGYQYEREYLKTALSIIDGHEDFFIKVLFDFQKIINKPTLSRIIVCTFWPKRVDIFKGKMTSEGDFYYLVNNYAYKNNLFKFDDREVVIKYVKDVLALKPTSIIFKRRENFRGDNCLYFLVYKIKSKKKYISKCKDFRIFPTSIIDSINILISDYLNNKK